MTRINAKVRNADTIIPKNITLTNVSKSDFGLDNVDNTSDANKPISIATQAALDLKANQSTTYTKTEVDTNIAALVNGAPDQLNTLNELASALDNDPNSIATLTASIATKATNISPTFSGLTTFENSVQMNDSLDVTATVTANAFNGTISTNAQPNITSVGTLDSLTLGGDIDLSNNNIISGNSITATTLVGTLSAAAQPNITSIGSAGGLSIGGNIDMGNNSLSNGATLTANFFDSASNAYKASGTTVLTNDTLGSTVVNSSLTSVGTLTSLTLGGNIDLGTNSITNASSVTSTSMIADSIEVDRIQSNGALLIEPSTQNDITIQSGRDNTLPFADGTSVIILPNRGVSGGAIGNVQIGGKVSNESSNTYIGISKADYDANINGVSSTFLGTVFQANRNSVLIKSIDTSNIFYNNLGKRPLRVEGLDDSIVEIRAGDTTSTTGIEFGDTGDFDIGSILYNHTDDTMKFSTNASTQVTILSDGKVGIGTETPSQKLSVSGDISATNFRGDLIGTITTSAQPNISEVGTITTGVWQGTPIVDAYISSSSTWNTVTGKQDNLTFGIADTNSVVIDATTNVPANGSYARFTASGIEGLTSADVLSDLGLTDGSGILNVTSVQATSLSPNSITATSISTTTGTITTAPSANDDITNKLYVDTQVAALVNSAPGTLDTLNELATALGNDANFATTVTDSLALKAPINQPTFTNDVRVHGPIGGTGRLYIQDTDQGTNLGDSFLLAKSGKNAFVKNRQDGDVRFGTNDIDRMTIDANGKIGVGTTSPTAVFQILSSDGTAFSSTSDSGQRSAGSTIEITNESNTTNAFSQLLFGNRNANKVVTRIVSINTGTNTADLAFTTESANTKKESMRIKGNGDVGIGTAAPDQPLHISRNVPDFARIKIDNINASGGTTLRFSEGATDNAALYFNNPASQLTLQNAVAGGTLRLQTTNDANLTQNGIYISKDADVYIPNGSVSIGAQEATSTEKLRVTGNINVLGEITCSDALPRLNLLTDVTNRKAEIYMDSGGVLKITSRNGSSNGIIDFQQTNGTTVTVPMKISSLGNVGMGTLAPSAKLHVASDDDIEVKIESGNTSTAKIEFAKTSANNRGYIEYDHSGDVLKFGANATDKVEITSSGVQVFGGSISSSGTITSTSSNKRPIQNNEADINPVRNIRRMSQSDYNTLVSNNEVDAFTFYIIV